MMMFKGWPTCVQALPVAGAGTIIVSVGTPVALTAPPASQVVDGSKLGL
jgi:hypothetical protein